MILAELYACINCGLQSLHLQEASFTALQKSDSAGWAIRAEIQAAGSVANGTKFLCSVGPLCDSSVMAKLYIRHVLLILKP